LKKYFFFFLLLLAAPSFAQRSVKLKIIHWNDFHAQNIPKGIKSSDGLQHDVGGFAYFKAVIDSLKQIASAHNEPYLVLDGGDNFQGTPISGFTRGASQITLMNIIHPDAVTIGNHDLDYGWKNLDSLFRFKALFNIVNANITHPNGSPFVLPYIIKQVGNLKIGIIGLIVEDLKDITLPERIKGLNISSCKQALRKYLPEVQKAKPNLIIVLSHIGIDGDRELAKKFPEVNIFVGGHSHTAITKPIKENKSIIVQAGSRGQYVGDLELSIDPDSDTIISFTEKLIETRNDIITPDTTILRLIDSMEAPINAKLGQKIGILKRDWKLSHKKYSNLAYFESMVFREDLKCDIGIINYGGLRKPLAAGPISMRDMYEINPFGNEIVIFSVSGTELKKALEWMFGDNGGESCEFSGLTCILDTTKKEGKRISNILLFSRPLDLKNKYSIATNIFIATHLYSMFGLDEKMHTLQHTGITDIDLLIAGIRKRKIITGESEEWVKSF